MPADLATRTCSTGSAGHGPHAEDQLQALIAALALAADRYAKTRTAGTDTGGAP
jgi:hypothetical protein